MSTDKLPNWIQQHRKQYLADPVAAHDWDASVAGGSGLVPTLLLTTIGRHSGEARATPLLYQPSGQGMIVVASKGGAAQHPDWYLNLLANPDCRVQQGRFEYAARARTLDGAERTKYWTWMVNFWPQYTDYQARTDREIPVVVLAFAD